jgi:hypothetical protein
MDAQQLDTHKKVLGIIYVITASLTILVAIFIRAILGIVFEFAAQEDPGVARVADFVTALSAIVPALILIFSSIPTMIAGVGLLMRQSWAPTFALIMGCLKLISFPIGTAIGIYSIWIYSEDQKFKKSVAVKV